MGPLGDGERERLARVFKGYREDQRRRRWWDADNPGNAAIREELARASLAVLAEHDAGGLLLDAGCGSGWWLGRLLAEGVHPARLVGLELLSERVHAARARVPGVRVIGGDARCLPLEDRSCSLVTLFTVLSGMASAADVDAALAEARRVVAPDGAVVIWEPRVVTPNPDTRLIRRSDLHRALGPGMRQRSITLAPPLARRAGPAYRMLAALPPLRSHRFVVATPRGGSEPG